MKEEGAKRSMIQLTWLFYQYLSRYGSSKLEPKFSFIGELSKVSENLLIFDIF